MKRTISIFLLLIIWISFGSPVFAVDDALIAELRRKIEELEREADQQRDNIAGERAKAQSLKSEIALLKKEITGIETQITLTSKKIDKTKVEITGLEDQIFETQDVIDKQRGSIGELLVLLSQRDNENLLATLMKNENLSTFLTEAQQTANVNIQLLHLIGDLRGRKRQLEDSKNSLEGKKSDLVTLNQENSAKKFSLVDVSKQKDNLLIRTKGQEAEYQKMLNEIEQRKTKFFIELQKLENQIILGGTYIVHVTAKNLPPKGTKLFIWPEDKYRITQNYGCTQYARCKRASGPYGGAPHNGIDLAGGFGTPIKSIGAGQIIANGSNPGWGNWVAIQHPPYDLVSIYGHMSALSPLYVGTEVKQGQVIGYEGATGNVTGPHLHISLYKDFFTYVNESKGGQLYFNYFEGSINPQDYIK